MNKLFKFKTKNNVASKKGVTPEPENRTQLQIKQQIANLKEEARKLRAQGKMEEALHRETEFSNLEAQFLNTEKNSVSEAMLSLTKAISGVESALYSVTHPKALCLFVSLGIREQSEKLQSIVPRTIEKCAEMWKEGGLVQ